MIPTPVEVVYNSRERLWCLTFEYHDFRMHMLYNDVAGLRYEQEWSNK